MTEENASAHEADREPIVDAQDAGDTEGQTEGQAAEAAEAEGQGAVEEKKSEAAKRRERDKALKERLRKEADDAKAALDRAEKRRLQIINAGESEKAPAESDFPDYTDYIAAKAVWTAEQRAAQRQVSDAEQEAEQARKRQTEIQAAERSIMAQNWAEQVQDAKARYTDFEAVALDHSVPISDSMAALIQSSDIGADVAYFLGKNREAAAEISKLSTIEAARAIGRIEASLQAPKARTETNAPPPMTPVRGAAKATRDPSKMSFEEYKAARESGKLR